MEATTRRGALQIIRDEHSTLGAILRSLLQMLARGPAGNPGQFFDVVRAMLFYIDEFPEKRHHPKESGLLFPMLLRAAPELAPVVDELEREHARGEARIRELQHLLLRWELLGDGHSGMFSDAARDYVTFYLHHMKVEEAHVLPVAERVLASTERAELDVAFRTNRDPLGPDGHQGSYERLFTRIVMNAPAPIGLGPA
ncbi:hemerythrin domain-containing protein [Caenimonas sedimenti]|uniref:Hemerythrin domain-containing protein n=1 Tax=Caenimonas sedimenti TaxID=2596921 RepID=A0A562ZWH3_9BURK|nr:hemerythrin domain-containing protein [Caenimonas sedimenti]TWO72721.1 hemerythrin domain-containing protein [Caenimonas sedimenti]